MCMEYQLKGEYNFVSEEHVINYVSQMLKINYNDMLAESFKKEFDAENVNGLVDDTREDFEKYAMSLGIDVTQQGKQSFDPYDFLKDEFRLEQQN